MPTIERPARHHGRLRRSARAAAIVFVSFGSVATLTAINVGSASAQTTEMAVNALASEVTTSARQAVEALEAYEASGSVADELTLAWHRAVTARYAARQLGYDELRMIDAWSKADLPHQRAVLGALTQVGVPYRTNTSIEGEGFDCSGLTTFAWKGAGIDLFRQSGSQISEAKAITRETAQAGDLVYYPGHIMMYLGVDNAVVHSVSTGRTVELDEIHGRRQNSVRWGDPTASD